MATLGEVIHTAQTVYLNDFNQMIWTQQQLTAFAQEAHRQMQVELQVNGIPVIKQQAFRTTVPALVPNNWPGYVLMPNAPNNIVEPLRCYERPLNDTLNSDWDLMIQKSFTPKQEPINDLVYWSWMGDNIVFLGATVDNEISLEYNGGIPVPTLDLDDLGFINAEIYIAPKLAALASESIGGKAKSVRCETIAREMMEKILQYNILAEQGMISRRRPYRHSRPQVIR